MQNTTSDSDRQLVAEYLAGNEKCLEILIHRHLAAVYSFICRYVGSPEAAEDIVQEAFVKVWKNLKKFDQKRNFKTWLFCIAKNTAVDLLRKKKSVTFSQLFNNAGKTQEADIAEQIFADPAPLPDEMIERADIASALNSAMEKLSSKYRAVLFLRYNDHFSFRQIAESLQEPLNTIKSRHRRALVTLRNLLVESK